MQNKYGIIAGNGNFPIVLAQHLSKSSKCFIAYIGSKENKNLYSTYSFKYFSLGQVGNIIKYFHSNGVHELFIIGRIERPNFSEIKLDFQGGILVSKILREKFLGDDKLLNIVIQFLHDKGFTILSAKDYLSFDKSSFNTNLLPKAEFLPNIKLGMEVLKKLSDLDIGQAVVVEDGYVLGVEAAEGTDNLILRCANLAKGNNAILIKMKKENQTDLVDLPSIGENTIELLIEHKYKGIAIDKNVLTINQEKFLTKLEKNHLFFHIIESDL